jgi:hypothetical protein
MVGDFSEYQSSIYKAFINASIIAFLLGLFSTGSVSINCYQAGYITLGLALMLILIKIINNIQTKKGDDSVSIGTIMLNIIPFVMILLIISSLLYFNTIYRDIIIEERISSGFNIFSNVVIILLIIQTYVISTAISSKSFNEKGVSKVTSCILLLLALLAGISTNIIRVILKFFTTDGFDIFRV